MNNDKIKNLKIETRLKILKDNYIFVPFINLVFLLMIFLMLSNSFVQVSAINVSLPSVAGQPVNAEKLIVTIDKNSNFYFNDQVMNLATLKQQLSTLSTKYKIDSIIVRADKDTPQGSVAEVLALANAINLNVYFAVSTEKPVEQVPFETK